MNSIAEQYTPAEQNKICPFLLLYNSCGETLDIYCYIGAVWHLALLKISFSVLISVNINGYPDKLHKLTVYPEDPFRLKLYPDNVNLKKSLSGYLLLTGYPLIYPDLLYPDTNTNNDCTILADLCNINLILRKSR